MIPETFAARRGAVLEKLSQLRKLLTATPSGEALAGEVTAIESHAAIPLTVLAAGPDSPGKASILTHLFGGAITQAKPKRSGPVIRLVKHQTLPPEPELPLGVEEFFAQEPALEGFVVAELPGLGEGDLLLGQMHRHLMPLADLAFICFSSDDPWHSQTWGILQELRPKIAGRFAILLSGSGMAGSETAGSLDYFRKTATKKFGGGLPIFALDPSEPSSLAEIANFFHTTILSMPKVVSLLSGARVSALRVADRAEQKAREQLEALRRDELRVIDLERKLLAQHHWLRLQIDQASGVLLELADPAITRAAELFDNETAPSRLHNVFARRNRVAEELQASVGEALRKLLLPKLEALALSVEEQIHSSWRQISTESTSPLARGLDAVLGSGPRLSEARQVCVNRIDVALGATVSGRPAIASAGSLISHACGGQLLSLSILLFSTIGGLLGAFQGGCEIAGGSVVGSGALLAAFAFFGAYRARTTLSNTYRQLLAEKVELASRQLLDQIRQFGGGLLDDLGKRVAEGTNTLADSRRNLQAAIQPLADLRRNLAEGEFSQP